MNARAMVLAVTISAICAAGCATTKSKTMYAVLPNKQLSKNIGLYIKVFKVRLVIPEAVWDRGPNFDGTPFYDINTHHVEAVDVVKRVLEAKGYAVEFVWDDPWTYGRLRPCPLQQGTTPDPEAGPCPRTNFRGYQYKMSQFSGTLAEGEAFLELGTVSLAEPVTTYRTVQTSEEVGTVVDEDGNEVGTVVAEGERTEARTSMDLFASATMQVFVHGGPMPAFDGQSWSESTASLAPVIERVLAKIPARVQ